ncbi:hypothetical protein HGRIS_004593 [Hohenbuehelia grisea]|uniref:Uncharacterized protein n=1 Tax=Hohenbuehelia grisea TaxID=104357 RepID=A0ABR3JD50_9AGAR
MQDLLIASSTIIEAHPSIFRIVMTGRPESHLQQRLRRPEFQVMTKCLHLQDYDASGDIRIYLTTRLQDVYLTYSDVMPDSQLPWPSKEEVEILVDRSSGLFIYAATVADFVGSADDLPQHRLVIALQSGPRAPGQLSPFDPLDNLYRQVLSSASYSDALQRALGSVVFALDAMSINEIAAILTMEAPRVRLIFRPLSAVLHLPGENEGAIHIHHQSLREFLTYGDRAGVFFLDPDKHNAELSRACIHLLDLYLTRDIRPLLDNNNAHIAAMEAPVNGSQLVSTVGGALSYVCRYWAGHLDRCKREDVDLSLLHVFVTQSILLWVEALGMLGELRHAVPSIRSVQHWLKRTTPDNDGIVAILRDTEKCVLAFYDAISTSPGQTYISGIPFLPSGSALKQQYRDQDASKRTVSVMYSGVRKECTPEFFSVQHA